VTELTQHEADDGFHEIQLSGKQVVFAFMLTTAAAVFIFLLGVQVGRNAKTTVRADEPETAATSPVSAAQPPAPAPVAGTPGGEPPAPAADADLDYSKRLESDKPLPEKLNAKANSEAAAPAPAAQPNIPPAVAATKDTTKDARGTAKETKASAAEDHPAPEKPAAASAARPGVWVVQLVALKDRGAAAAVVQRLSAKGYPAFIVNPAPGAPAIYRVQVGRYDDRREAEQIARRLEKEEQFKPWISH
jgi:cell division septation protein DedD